MPQMIRPELTLAGFSVAARRAALGQVAAQGPRTVTLPDGTTGYYIRDGRLDDCLVPSIATVIQHDSRDMPYLDLERRIAAGDDPKTVDAEAWRTVTRWLQAHGWNIKVHTTVPIQRRRWVGVVPLKGWFQSHCIVMAGRDRLHDPTDALLEHGTNAYGPADVRWGISFTRRKGRN